MESDKKATPAWLAIAGWASAAAALVFVVVGAVFLQPSGDRSIEVSKPFNAGLGLDSLEDAANADGAAIALADDGDGAASEVAGDVVGGDTEAGVGADDPAPPDLSFVDDGEPPPPLVDASPLENPDLGPAAVDDGGAAEVPPEEDLAADGVADAAAPTAAPASAETGFRDPFETVGPPWVALAGSWLGSGGRFVQQDTEGYDLMAQLELDVPDAYRLSVVVAPMSGALSAGVLIGQQTPGERAGAYLVDFSENGTVLRFGQYLEADASYEYIEGLGVPEGFDPAGTHTLAIVVEPTETTVFLDGEFFATFGPASPGRVGLVTNAAATAFDEFVIEPV